MHLIELIWADPVLRQYYISAVLIVVPVTRILIRAGFKPYWVVLLAVPEAGLALCAVLLAHRKWSSQTKGA